jgi:predicted dehydrogenase
VNVKILIAGLGSIGRRHLRNLIALDERDIVLYRTHQSTLPDDELAAFPVETDLSAALGYKPDAVIVANPTAHHLDVALPAVQAGCHLLLEKPVAEKLGLGVTLLQETVAQAGVKTLVGFQFRFHPVLEAVKKVLDSGQIGRPLSFRAHWGEFLPSWHPWEDYRQGYAARKALGGGVVNTLCHPLDYVRWIFGEVHSLFGVTAQASDLELDVEDLAEITLRFESGVTGSVHLNYFQQPPTHWLEVTTTGGFIRWENESGAAKVYYSTEDRWMTLSPPPEFERNALFLAEMKHFLAIISGQEAPRCSLTDGIKALVLAAAVHESAMMGVMVDIPPLAPDPRA